MTARIIPLVRPNAHDLAAELREFRHLARRLGNRVLADVQGTQGARLEALAAAGASARVAVDLRDGQVRITIAQPDGSEALLLARGWPTEGGEDVA